MRILISGGSGFLGVPLIERLRASGHDVTRLVRRPAQAPDEATWQPSQGQLDPHVVAAADVVINLSGANVGGKRWTARYKSELRSSRVDTTGTIARAISKLPEADRPRTLLQASAVGWYGDTGDNPVTEEAPAGSTFLADLCRVWEAAARPAEDAGVRVVLLRTGIAVETLVERLLLVFKLGGGAKLGGGKQWMPWCDAPNWLAAAEFLLDREDVTGPVNIVGREPATNAEFTKAFADAVHRPALLSVPSPALHLVLGELAGESLRSSRVVPAVLERAGFQWPHPTIDSALEAAVGKEAAASR
ncbi:TIGR01777 family oxidoreductase [Paractinoplanes lichenicola]|uniref:TIGR01777 family oxidoreductase n=1 Tax=Paractinoplanes lichenicola TaxID=2802976 RepID=A0ABS1VS69_9ACTN|nr:TIGR01777 family oxidoreductase [Actinoplanes lichenicola]MBL7256441.1 TIGR01777 family oxidoreductase [Actinoplanes lichenicola]